MGKKNLNNKNSKIHITFNSEEDKRIVLPILKQKPEKIYYFKAYIEKTGQKDQHLDFLEKNVAWIKKELPNAEIVIQDIDYTNYIKVIQEISLIIKNERKKNPKCEILINMGCGSKITALASAEAARLWDCNVIYVFSTLYDPSHEGARHKGKFFIFEPPVFPALKPEAELIEVLKLLNECIERKYNEKDVVVPIEQRFIYKKNFIQFLISKGKLPLKKKSEDPQKLKSSYYMTANKKFLNHLEKELQYITISDDKKNKKIYLTEKGRNVLEIFKFLN
ncbi:MAG: HFX_2341 family transcriptional regulator domain-containing protein [Promethearchaeota archaeon]